MSARCRLILLSLLSGPLAMAAPAWQGELTSPAPGPFPALAPTVLDLKVSWKGTVNAGSIRMESAPPAAKKPGSLVIRSSSSSHGAASMLFPYQSSFWSELNPATLRPRYFHAMEADKKETATTTVRYFPDRVESQETTRIFKTGTTKQTDRIFRFAPVFDIFSAMLHVRSQKLDAGDRITLVIHPFDNPYLLRVNVRGREIHNGRNTIRLTMGMHKIDRKTLELLPYKKLKKDATLWLSDDADRVPVELRATAFIGDVRAILTAHAQP